MSFVKTWESSTNIIAGARKVLDSFKLATPDSPDDPVPLARLAADLVRDPSKAEKLIRDAPQIARNLAIYLLFRVLVNHLIACHHLLRLALCQEAGILLRSMLEVVDLMEFVRSDRCSTADLARWWRGEIVTHGTARKDATTSVFKGQLYHEVPEAITPGKPTITQQLRKLQYGIGSGYVHHTSRRIAETTLAEFFEDEDPLAEMFAEFDNFLVWMLRALYLYFGDFLSDDMRERFRELSKEVQRVVFDDDHDEVCAELSSHYRRRSGAL